MSLKLCFVTTDVFYLSMHLTFAFRSENLDLSIEPELSLIMYVFYFHINVHAILMLRKEC